MVEVMKASYALEGFQKNEYDLWATTAKGKTEKEEFQWNFHIDENDNDKASKCLSKSEGSGFKMDRRAAETMGSAYEAVPLCYVL